MADGGWTIEFLEESAFTAILTLVFHDVRTRKLSDDASTVRRVLIPLASNSYEPDRNSDSTSESAEADNDSGSRAERS